MEKINDIEKRLANKETKISVSAKEEALIDTYKVALEACARGIKIANINLKTSDAKKFIIDRERNCLIPPFRALAGLGEAVAESIISERNKRPFESKEDLMSRTKINKNHFKQLIDLGALNDLSDTAQMSLNEFFD
jgi:DNA polymerase-3 subunit alpha (Gram-positive type)